MIMKNSIIVKDQQKSDEIWNMIMKDFTKSEDKQKSDVIRMIMKDSIINEY